MNGRPPNLRQKWSSSVTNLKNISEKLALYVKNSSAVDIKKINVQCTELKDEIEKTMTALKSEIVLEERMKLQEVEKKLKKEEMEKIRENERAKILERQKEQRHLLEERRIQEEEEYIMNEAFIEEQRKIEEELRLKKQRKDEQERLDAELVKRLVQEDQCIHLVDNGLPETEHAVSQKRYDLSQWKYADLRDIINTSNDIELLTACKDEFHKRMQVYQQWKQKTDSQTQQQLRAPVSVVNAATSFPISLPSSSKQVNIQRYFKVPFTRPTERHKHLLGFLDSETPKGLWYAHFDGQWIARQMEIHPNKNPVLLIAGRDDVDMCEIPLESTHLTRKKGAEILENEFEALWQSYGGPPYQRGFAQSRRKH